jgi:hypothetical protein
MFDLTYTVRPLAFWASDERIGFEDNLVLVPPTRELWHI